MRKITDRHYLAWKRDHRRLSEEENVRLILQAQQDGPDAIAARNAVIENWLPFLLRITSDLLGERFRLYLFDEMVSVSVSVFMERIIPGYKPERGTKFATYVAKSLRKELNQFLALRRWRVRVPEYLHDHIRQLDRICPDQAGLTPECIARLLGVKLRCANHIREALAFRRFADEWPEEVQDSRTQSGDEYEKHEEYEQLLNQAFRALSDLERGVIQVGWLCHVSPSRREMARQLGITENHVRTVEKRAFTKMREALCA